MDNFFTFRTGNKIIIRAEMPEAEMSIIKRLGKPKFWISNNDFNEIMEKIYKTASKYANEKYKINIDKREFNNLNKEIA